MIGNSYFKLNNKKKYLSLVTYFIALVFLISYVASINAVEDFEYFTLKINKVEIFGDNMKNKILFSKGDNVFLNITIEKPLTYFLLSEMDGITDYKLIITVMDATRAPTFIDVIDSSIDLGETRTLSLSFKVPSESIIGKYVIKALVWENDGIPLSKTIGEAFFYVA